MSERRLHVEIAIDRARGFIALAGPGFGERRLCRSRPKGRWLQTCGDDCQGHRSVEEIAERGRDRRAEVSDRPIDFIPAQVAGGRSTRRCLHDSRYQGARNQGPSLALRSIQRCNAALHEKGFFGNFHRPHKKGIPKVKKIPGIFRGESMSRPVPVLNLQTELFCTDMMCCMW